MAHSYSFAIIRLCPRDARDERINVGAVVFSDEGIDIRITKRLERVRAFSSAIEIADMRALLDSLRRLDGQLVDAGIVNFDERARHLSLVGPVGLSGLGTFTAVEGAYEARLASIMRTMVEPEPAPTKVREKRSRLLTQLKKQFRDERVLAQRGEDLTSHRIVAGFELDEGLVADLVLKNGAMHVVQTVDATGDQESSRRALGDIGISALVLERARMRFGEKETKTRLVYSASSNLEKIALPSLEAAAHQGAELTNWSSQNDRLKFVRSMSSVADPIPIRRTRIGKRWSRNTTRFA